MKKILIFLLMFFIFKANAQNILNKDDYINNYESYLEVIVEDSTITIQKVDNKINNSIWKEISSKKDFKNITEVFSFLSEFDFFPEKIQYNEWSEETFILMHRKLQDIYEKVNNKTS